MSRSTGALHWGLVRLAFLAVCSLTASGQVTLGYSIPLTHLGAKESQEAIEDLRQGRFDSARNRYQRLLALFAQGTVQGQDYYGFGVGGAVTGAAYVATIIGDFQYAESLYSQLQPRLSRRFEERGTPRVVVQTAETKIAEGRAAEAIQLLRASMKEATSKGVLSYRYLWNLMAEACLETDDLAGAEAAFQRALDLWKGQKLREWNHRMVRGRLDRTGGKIMRTNGALAESEELIRSALAMHDGDLAPESWDGIQDRFELGVTLHELKKYSEAEALYQFTFRTIKDRLGLRQPLAAKSLVHYERLLRETGRDVDADKIKSFLAP